MLFVSIVWALIMLPTQYYWWTRDWWRPQTFTGTHVGIEDFLVGFFAGGVAAIVYEVLFHERHVHMRLRRAQRSNIHRFATLILVVGLGVTLACFAFGLTSFYASSAGFLIIAFTMFLTRKDLFIDGILSGVLMTAVSIISYTLIKVLSPDWIAHTYLWPTLSGVSVIGVPIEEFIFWFLAGLVFGPLYEFWQGERLVKIKR